MTDSILHDLITAILVAIAAVIASVYWTEYGTRFDGRAVAVPCSHRTPPVVRELRGRW